MIEFDTESVPTKTNAILLCADEVYEKYAFALIKQLVDAGMHEKADICFVTQHKVTPPTTLADVPVRYMQISLDIRPEDFPLRIHLTFASYLRLFSIEKLAEDYGKVLYLDTDIYLADNDLADLLELNPLPQHAVAAVRDCCYLGDMRTRSPEADAMGLPHFAYFNSGVLLVDTGRWRSQNLLARCLDVVEKHPDALLFADQSALNITLNGNWSELSWHWNLSYFHTPTKWVRRVNPCLLHFAGLKKPWHPNTFYDGTPYQLHYKDFLAEHYQMALQPIPGKKEADKPELTVSDPQVPEAQGSVTKTNFGRPSRRRFLRNLRNMGRKARRLIGRSSRRKFLRNLRKTGRKARQMIRKLYKHNALRRVYRQKLRPLSLRILEWVRTRNDFKEYVGRFKTKSDVIDASES